MTRDVYGTRSGVSRDRYKRINRRLNRFGISKAKDLDSSAGLYDLALKSGLKPEADRIVKQHTGEDVKKIFSGGFISDIFDVLNAAQYGVTGMLKGKSFGEGVKTRQSFSDKDALGDNGIPGVIAGLMLDIAVDPLTYIAPWTILKKIPGVVKGVKLAEELTVGKKVITGIEDPVQKLTKLSEKREGGTRVGKYLAEKFVYGFGVDPVYRILSERTTKNIGSAMTTATDMIKQTVKFDPKISEKLLTRKPDGTFIRTGLKELKETLSPEELEKVKGIWSNIDNLGKEAVELGLLSKSKFEEGLGEYIKNAFKQYETFGGLGIFGKKVPKIKGIKAKKTSEEWASGFLKSKDIEEVKKLYPEAIDRMGKINIKDLPQETLDKIASKAKTEFEQIKDPAYLLWKTTLDLTTDVENAKFFNQMNKHFGSDIALPGYVQVSKAARFNTTAGARAGILSEVKGINTKLKPMFTEMKHAFKADKSVMSQIKNLEKEISSLSGRQTDEFTKFFKVGEKIKTISKEGRLIRGVGKLPDDLQLLGEKVKKFKSLDEMKKSDVGLQVEKLYEDGVLERAGFKSIKDFFDFIKVPFKKVGGKTRDILVKENIDKIINLQKRIEKLTRKSTKMKAIDKRSINDALRTWEKQINDLKFDKEGLIGRLEDLKLSQLGGKYVPEDIHKLINEIINPDPVTFGKKAIAGFKYSKVILNPSTHARNILSNMTLNWWKLGIGPWRIDLYKEAFKQARRGGKWVDELKKAKVGYNIDTFASNEFKHILDSSEQFGAKTNTLINKWKNKLGDLYQGEENVAKLAAYIHHRKKGIGIEEAWKAAESATFNYAQVTPFVRKLRTSIWGMPFITFGLKAAPIAVETALKHPRRVSVIGKIKNSIEDLSDIKETQRERATEAPWIKDGFYIKLPIKDKEGRSAYFDLTYIIPFGDLVSGQFTERQISRETGLVESLPVAAMSKFPTFNFIKEIARNQDFSGRRIWRDSDSMEKQTSDLMRHLTKTYMPPLISDQIPGGYNSKGERVPSGFIKAATGDKKGTQQRNLMQEMLKVVGLKIQPIDVDVQESMNEWNRKKGLRTLLKDRNAVKDFSSTYIPKKD